MVTFFYNYRVLLHAYGLYSCSENVTWNIRSDSN